MNMATKEIPVEDTRDWRPSGLIPTSAEICHLRGRVLVEDIIVKRIFHRSQPPRWMGST
jgi:hypothetical protein